MMPAAAPAQPDEPAVLEGAVKHRLVLDEAFVKSGEAVPGECRYDKRPPQKRETTRKFA
jgi:hypothetical protein